MFLTTFYRITKTAMFSLWRNRWLSLAATLIMVLTLVTISFFISLLFITGKTTAALKDKADITVYFQDSASKDQIFAIQSILMNRSDVKNAQYVSKEDALVLWKERQTDESIRNIISETDNPLPRSLEIKTERPEDLTNINTLLLGDEYKPIVKKVSFEKNKQLIDRLVKMTNFIKIVGYSLSTLFVLISILIIYNTVRLTIFARSEEIEIMKLVGGSDWYVRGPFIIEGISYGILGAIVSSVIFVLIFKLTVPAIQTYLGFADLNSSYLGLNLGLTIFAQFAIGVALGGGCSIAAIKKYLK